MLVYNQLFADLNHYKWRALRRPAKIERLLQLLTIAVQDLKLGILIIPTRIKWKRCAGFDWEEEGKYSNHLRPSQRPRVTLALTLKRNSKSTAAYKPDRGFSDWYVARILRTWHTGKHISFQSYTRPSLNCLFIVGNKIADCAIDVLSNTHGNRERICRLLTTNSAFLDAQVNMLLAALWQFRCFYLSMYLSNGGIPSDSPFLFLVSKTMPLDFEPASSIGSSWIICQWSNTHCENALPPVLLRRSAVTPVEIEEGNQKCVSHYDMQHILIERIEASHVLVNGWKSHTKQKMTDP